MSVKEQFKMQFISTFLATWVASHYDLACARGEHKKLDSPPAEDAEFLAEKAWEELVRLEIWPATKEV